MRLVRVAGVWWRQVRAGADPLAGADPAPDSRWQRGARVGGLYLADSAETAWAEWYRFLAEAAIPPRVALPRDMARVTVDADAVADLSGEEELAEAGLSVPRPSRRGWRTFQRVGEELAAGGAAGVIAPSAARPEGRVLCLFRGGGQDPVPLCSVEAVETAAEPPLVPRGLTT